MINFLDRKYAVPGQEQEPIDFLAPKQAPAQPSFDNRDWSALPGMERDKRSIDEVIARERELNPTTIGNDIARGVSAFGQSALRGLKHPFSSPKDQQAMEAQGMLAKMGQQGESTAFNVGRNAPPFMAPGLGAARTVPLMLEGAGTAAAMGKLDFDERASNLDLAGDAALGAAVPGLLRGVGHVFRETPLGALAGYTKKDLPTREGAAERLQAGGFKLAPGEASGSATLQTAENMRARKPGARKAFQNLKDHNRDLSGQIAAKAIGAPADTTRITEGVKASAHNRIKNKLDELVTGSTVPFDAELYQDLATIKAGTGSEVVEGLAGKGEDAAALLEKWKRQILRTPEISGEEFQLLDSRVGMKASDAFSSGNAELGRTYRDIQSALQDAASRGLGGDKKAEYLNAKKQYANLQVLQGEKGGSPPVDAFGVVQPTAVRDALKKNKSFKDKRSRGEKATDLDLIWDYADVEVRLPTLPPVANNSLTTQLLYHQPKFAYDYHPNRAMLANANQAPAEVTGPGVGAVMGRGLGGSQMTDTLFNAVIGNIQGGQQSDDGSGIWGSGLMDALQGMAVKPY